MSGFKMFNAHKLGVEWSNWAGTQRCQPSDWHTPTTAEEVASIVTQAVQDGTPIKAVGSGHSFSSIALSAGVQLRTHGLSGLLHVDRERKEATFLGGTTLHRASALLEPYGLALENLGDIDQQTIAGAISTGTHGTGLKFGVLPTQVKALKIVTGTGALISCSEENNPEVFSAARLGLGAIGIIVEVTIQCVDAFILHAQERREPLAGVLESFTERAASVDHFEFFWFPHTNTALSKSNTRLPAGTGPEYHQNTSVPGRLNPIGKFVDETVVSNILFDGLNRVLHRFPAAVPRTNRVVTHLTGNREYSDRSHLVFATPRTIKFREMEYALPLEQVPEVVRELEAMIARKKLNVPFPVEVRCAAADSIPLSTANGRLTGYVAVHAYVQTEFTEYFRAAEEIFLAHGGRPHWGKVHFLDYQVLGGLYPSMEKFCSVRDVVDPGHVFNNEYLARVLPPFGG
ncbi:D-arabinono-1,4-lactone oxidase [Pseudarthrobacter sp. J1738]|uniref:D-arabinono-1,4-lactone oxidase n=1 Tax=unclassified Pseudarthrobacter TaxID=2647000 RepID=UPI003D2C80E5